MAGLLVTGLTIGALALSVLTVAAVVALPVAFLPDEQAAKQITDISTTSAEDIFIILIIR
jgi:hypothetical protein